LQGFGKISAEMEGKRGYLLIGVKAKRLTNALQMCYLCTVAPRFQHTLSSRKHHILYPNLHTQTVRQQVAEPFFSRISYSETARSPHSSAAEKLTAGLGKVIPSRPCLFVNKVDT